MSRSEIPEAAHRDPLADGSTQPRFQLSPDKTSPDDHIQHKKAQADDSPSLAAKQVEIHVRNKANNTFEGSAADEIMEPQMADHFPFMEKHDLGEATDASSELANDPPIQLLGRITTVKELLATGLFQNEEIIYTQKSGERKKLEGRIDGLFYRCSCHNVVMSASKFEKHAGCTSHNQNDRIMLWGEQSLHAIVAYLKSLGSAEEQLAAILEMKKKNEDRKASRDQG
ncbi:uncharacterized protein LOC119358048 [Triticum dicoccoides]|uniref:uncharacterized protein LOC119358048 n=1 Tax=Triticum dicoccoides TaxID=85692 RepID=UPI0018903CD9|nr:uncharacterized protein LOC119358048 [Triticum dicoccoides]